MIMINIIIIIASSMIIKYHHKKVYIVSHPSQWPQNKYEHI